jgi:GNAT superfamily N-acetyltransferase
MDSSANTLTQQFLKALIGSDSAEFDTCLHQDATLRLHTHTGIEVHRPRSRIVERLTAESNTWLNPTLETFSQHTTANKTAVEFRIQATVDGRFIEHNRAAFLTIIDQHLKTIDLYCPEPIPSAHRKNYIAPANISQAELDRLFDSNIFYHDVRKGVPPGMSGRLNLRRVRLERGGRHPGDNSLFGVRWTAEEADANIEALINYHRQKNIGFTWNVSSYDTPSDLAQRLENQGFVLAGEQAIMALTDLNTLDIQTNPDLKVVPLDSTNDEQIEATLQVISSAFQRTQEQIDKRRPGFFEDAKSGSQQNYLAYLDGRLVGQGRIDLSGSTAHLSGAATLPDYRGRGVYSTLLLHRLKVGREFGHQIATIDAQPMSKPIVARHGFKEYTTSYIYAWMPVMEINVVNSLIQSN